MPKTQPRFHPTEELQQDLRRLNEAAVANPNGAEERLLKVTLSRLKELQQGHPGTHPLEYMPSYPDLSDCRTTYVGTDPHSKPSHRIIWRDVEAEIPGQPATREIIAFGKRENGHAYHIAGNRLGRPVGMTLDELRRAPEPIAENAVPTAQHSPKIPAAETAKIPEPEMG